MKWFTIKNLGLALAMSVACLGWTGLALGADNLVKNGDFEDLEDNWQVIHPESGKIAFEKKGGPVGEAFARMSPTNSVQPNLFVIQQYTDDPKPGTYVAKVQFRMGEEYAGRMPVFYVNVLKPGGGYHGIYDLSPRKSAPAGQWIKLEKEFEIPAGTKRVYLQATCYGSMGYVDIDGLEVSLKSGGETTQPAK